MRKHQFFCRKMIINTGQRTDIPAFYPKWLIHRIREGFVCVRNPYYPSLVTKFRLDPDVVDCLGFCTKNPRPLFPYWEELKPFGQFWYVTITAFDRDLEPGVPPVEEVLKDVEFLSSQLGKDAIGWRYTPIIINEKYTVERHIATFRHIAEELDGKVRLAVYGFLDLYPRLAKLHPELHDCSAEDKILLSKAFAKIAKEHHLILRLCSKEKWLKDYGIDVDGCMRLEDYEIAIHHPLEPKKKMKARAGYCSCFLSNDIGVYSSCLHFCSYCYANGNKEQVLANYRKHDDASPFLIGNTLEKDKTTEAKQESWKKESEALSLF